MTFVHNSRRLAIALGLLSMLAGRVALATDFTPKTDNRIICLDLRTGKLIWEHVPGRLSDAHFEWYKQGVVAYPQYDGSNRTKPVFLDAESGKVVEPFANDPEKVLAKSATFWPGPEVKLDNGWRLTGFSAGYNKTLEFRDAAKQPAWTIRTGGYPHQVRSWKNFVFYAFSYLSKEGILYAYRAGATKPTWTLDLNQIVKGRARPLTRMIFQVIEDRIYLEANEHIFCINPRSGAVFWHRDLSKDLKLPFHGGFHGGALNLAVFGKSGDVLVIAFEQRVVALNLKSGNYLWHLEPDTFPHCPFPVVHGQRVVLTSGAKRSLKRLTRGR